MINPLNTHYAFENPASIYDEEAMTALQLAGRQGAKINEIIKDQNSLRETTETELSRQVNEVIPNTVSNEMQERIDDGTFDRKIDTYADSLQAQVTNTNERINNLASLEDGSTTGDAELIDLRTGVDGVTDTSAGEAVRRQFNNLPYPKRMIENQVVNLDELTEPGIYVFDSCTFENLPWTMSSTDTLPHYCAVELVKRHNTYPWKKQTVGYYNRSAEWNRFYMNTAWKPWRGVSTYLESTGDDTDRTDEINGALAWNLHCKLGPGVFHVKQIRIPAGALLEGCGEHTKIINAQDTATTVVLNSRATIRNIALVGDRADHHPDWASESIGNKIGITVSGETENAIIDSCYITGFSHSGIYLETTGTACRSVLISNCDVHYCWQGLNIKASEYACVSNCVFRDNAIGCNNLGGNNKFSACGFDSNAFGFIVSGDTNNGHGACVGCTFNHNERAGISLQKVDWGFIFSGCQIHYSKISTLKTTKGILFNGCNFGNNVPIDSSCETPLFFIGCTFYVNPLNVDGYLDEFDTTRYINSYNWQTGAQIGG